MQIHRAAILFPIDPRCPKMKIQPLLLWRTTPTSRDPQIINYFRNFLNKLQVQPLLRGKLLRKGTQQGEKIRKMIDCFLPSSSAFFFASKLRAKHRNKELIFERDRLLFFESMGYTMQSDRGEHRSWFAASHKMWGLSFASDFGNKFALHYSTINLSASMPPRCVFPAFVLLVLQTIYLDKNGKWKLCNFFWIEDE